MQPTRRPLSPDRLLAGPRGRRLLLELACEAERTARADGGGPLRHAVFDASYRLAKLAGRSVSRFGWPPVDPDEIPSTRPDAVAAALAGSPLPAPTPDVLRTCLARSVDAAMYWQGPDGDDLLAATAAVREGLRRVAEWVCATPASTWLAEGFAPDRQLTLDWPEARSPSYGPAAEMLGAWREDVTATESEAGRDRPADPGAPYSGTWWSTPPHGLPVTCPELFDGTPSGLWVAEDTVGWTRAIASRVEVPPATRVYEVDGPGDWAALCRAHPVEVTASRRHDWYRATSGFREPGWAGRWVVPDWAAVAAHYDAVHLTYAGYLSSAGLAIPVDDPASVDDTRSVIAGWNPGATYWLTDLAPSANAVRWHCVERADEPRWEIER